MSRLTNTLPPVDIFDVLHDYEVRGGTIPEVVDAWWEVETGFTWREQEARLNAVEVGKQPTTQQGMPETQDIKDRTLL